MILFQVCLNSGSFDHHSDFSTFLILQVLHDHYVFTTVKLL